MSALTAKQGFVCADCKNVFLQAPRCSTCGAQKLYDHTVTSQAKTIEHLCEKLRQWESGERVFGNE